MCHCPQEITMFIKPNRLLSARVTVCILDLNTFIHHTSVISHCAVTAVYSPHASGA